ncbi:hypothetical protein HKX48_004494 [Thoreauomyces humboldtii]|nr:hypothetical protein HKX48_004494 [Thoreauomyces humboldtii]
MATLKSPTEFTLQIAGHPGLFHQLPDGLISKACPQIEADFYTTLFESQRPDLVQFRSVLPRFAGHASPVEDVAKAHPKCTARIQLENILEPFVAPSVADIKVGVRLYGEDATEAKRLHMEDQAARTTSLATGLRICGMKVQHAPSGASLALDKRFGRTLTPETLPTGVRTFFTIPASSPSALVPLATLRSTLDRLSAVLVALETACVRLYGASLLVVYDEDGAADCRVIDFAHSHVVDVVEGPDAGALFGVRNLVAILEALIEESALASAADGLGMSP